jgi:SAM-dependent methyltransferase
MFPPRGDGRRVLDVGCGNGYLSKLLVDRGFRTTGIERRGGYTESFPQDVRLIEADLEAGVPPLGEQFDYILCADILEHVRDPALLLRQLRTLLVPGGCLIASLPNSGNLWFRLNILFGRFPQDDKGLFDRTHLHFYMWKGWMDLFASEGFRMLDVRPTAVPVGLAAPLSIRESVFVRAAESVSYRLACIWMKLFAYQFVVRALPVR